MEPRSYIPGAYYPAHRHPAQPVEVVQYSGQGVFLRTGVTHAYEESDFEWIGKQIEMPEAPVKDGWYWVTLLVGGIEDPTPVVAASSCQQWFVSGTPTLFVSRIIEPIVPPVR